jgi:hypothetical protein
MQNPLISCKERRVTTLKEILCAPPNRPKVVQDAARLVNDEVESKSGLGGIAIKTAYKAVNKIKPGLIPEVVDSLLDRFVDRMEPFYAEWKSGAAKESFESFMVSRKNRVANALLGVTDERARTVQNTTLKKSYEALRPQGEKHVEAAIPGLARLVTRYLPTA